MSRLYKQHPKDRSFTAVTLLGLVQIAEREGVQYNAMRQRWLRGRLPEPVAVIGGSPVWTSDQFEDLCDERAGDERTAMTG